LFLLLLFSSSVPTTFEEAGMHWIEGCFECPNNIAAKPENASGHIIDWRH